MPCPRPPRGLYAITPDEPDTARLAHLSRQVLRGGAAWLQYRNKVASPGLRREQAAELRALCREYDCAFIVNDDWALAAELDADGVHLGEDDGSLQAARAALGADRLIGASCYDSRERARDAVAAGADYIAFGAFFASPTKPHARVASTALLRDSAALGVPRVAIGGITVDNAAALVEAGADLVAVITGVFGAHDPEAAALRIASLFTPSITPSNPTALHE